jgi:hypothetical protein
MSKIYNTMGKTCIIVCPSCFSNPCKCHSHASQFSHCGYKQTQPACPPTCPPLTCSPNKCYPPPCGPCHPVAPSCPQGWTGPSGAGILTNANGAFSVGSGAAPPVSSELGAIAIGASSGIAGQSANSIALGRLAASGSLQPTNSLWVNLTGAAWATTYPANSAVVRTMTVIDPLNAGGFFVDAIKQGAGTANLKYDPVTAEISYIP